MNTPSLVGTVAQVAAWLILLLVLAGIATDVRRAAGSLKNMDERHQLAAIANEPPPAEPPHAAEFGTKVIDLHNDEPRLREE